MPSQARGQAGEEYVRELLFSPKERYEHHFVTEHIKRVLDFEPGEVFIREAGPVQHLCQEFVGATQLSAEELLEKLHPTPAVAGAPAHVIREIEGFDRVVVCWSYRICRWRKCHLRSCNSLRPLGKRFAYVVCRVWHYRGE